VVHAVRQPLYWAEDPLRRLGARPDYLTDPAWWRGFERMAGEGLTWDLLVCDEQIPAAHELIRSFPQTRIVLEAAGWTAIEIFGVQRCMFAAHFPIDRLLWSFDDLIQTLLATLHDLSSDDLQAFFSGCASREYQLEQAG
jgi:predicted TIM-barrel fold metal-dependent hydrolase